MQMKMQLSDVTIRDLLIYPINKWFKYFNLFNYLEEYDIK